MIAIGTALATLCEIAEHPLARVLRLGEHRAALVTGALDLGVCRFLCFDCPPLRGFGGGDPYLLGGVIRLGADGLRIVVGLGPCHLCCRADPLRVLIRVGTGVDRVLVGSLAGGCGLRIGLGAEVRGLLASFREQLVAGRASRGDELVGLSRRGQSQFLRVTGEVIRAGAGGG